MNKKEFKSNIHIKSIIKPTAVILGNVNIYKNVSIHDFVTLYPNVIIESDVEIFEGAVIGKTPKTTKAFSKKIQNNNHPTIIKRRSVISPHSVIYSDVEIGEDSFIGDGASIREQCRIGKNCIIGRNVSINYNTKVGDFTRIMDNSHITGNMKIGNNVFISALVVTTNDNKMGQKGYDDKHIIGPIIEDFVLIGAGANILPGVRIGTGSIVGAGAVVTKDVPPKKMVMGIPARIVKSLD